jgi:hypothetical protein
MTPDQSGDRASERSWVFQPPSLPPPEGPHNRGPRWYQRTAVVVTALILFFPVGITLLWLTTWRQRTKLVITSSVVALVVVSLVASAVGGEPDKKPAAVRVATTGQSLASVATTPGISASTTPATVVVDSTTPSTTRVTPTTTKATAAPTTRRPPRRRRSRPLRRPRCRGLRSPSSSFLASRE